MEKLTPIEGWEHKYAATPDGQIWNLKAPHGPRPLVQSLVKKTGYHIVLFYERLDYRRYRKEIKTVHRVIYTTFNGTIPKGHYIIFKDDNKDNLHIDNLDCTDNIDGKRGKKSIPIAVERVNPIAPNGRKHKIYFPNVIEAAKWLRVPAGHVSRLAKKEAMVGYKVTFVNTDKNIGNENKWLNT